MLWLTISVLLYVTNLPNVYFSIKSGSCHKELFVVSHGYSIDRIAMLIEGGNEGALWFESQISFLFYVLQHIFMIICYFYIHFLKVL